MQFLCCPGVGHLHTFLSPIISLRSLYEPRGPTVGLAAFPNKKDKRPGGMGTLIELIEPRVLYDKN